MSWQICKIYKHSTFSAYSALFWNLFFSKGGIFQQIEFEMNPEVLLRPAEGRTQHKNCVLSRSYFVNEVEHIVEDIFRTPPKLHATGCVIQLKMFRKIM